MSHVQPFPWGALDRTSRAEAAAAARLRRAAAGRVRVADVASVLAELCREQVELLVRRVRRAEVAGFADDAVGVVLAPAGAQAPARRVLVEVESALAAHLCARVLDRRSPRVTDPARTAQPTLAGGLAAIVHAAVRRAHDGQAMRVLSAGPGVALARDLLALEPDATAAWVTAVIGKDAFSVRVTVPDAAVLELAPRWSSSGEHPLRALGEAPLSLPLVVASCVTTGAELRRLTPGDAFLPGAGAVAVDAHGGISGRAVLVAARSERGIGCDLAGGGRLVVREGLEHHGWDVPPEETMSETGASTERTLEALEDAPVVVRVELGAVEMTARAWSELGSGDVLALGRRIGDAAVLRVGGVEVARGELVQVDGEIGVRILARAGAGT